MSRHYNMLHRVSYQQIIDVLKESKEPLFFEELYDLLPCEPNYITLECKLNKMVEKGMIKKDIEFVNGSPMNIWFV